MFIFVKIMDMKEKIEFLLRNKGLTSTQLARMLEIQPSGISHILSGRNKPSFDLVVKILRAFPDIDPDWLLLDGEQIFRTGESSPTSSADIATAAEVSLFDSTKNIEISEGLGEKKNEQAPIFLNRSLQQKAVKRVIILYADNTFESFSEM
jgi:transcriptional regulator with XRE-family HTH domain